MVKLKNESKLSEYADHILPYRAGLKVEKAYAVAMTFYLINPSVYVLRQQEMLNTWNISIRKKKFRFTVGSSITPFFLIHAE